MSQKLFRTFTLEANELIRSGEPGSPIELSASSDVPYRRRDYFEVLSHKNDAVDLTRLNSRAAVLVDHEGDQVGVVEKAWLDGGKLRANVRFSRSVRGQEIEQDVRDGIRSNVSIGYAISAYDDAKSRSRMDGVEVRTATSWLPFEISFVAVPADIGVGIGRSVEEAAAMDERAFKVSSESSSTQESASSTTYNDDGTTVSESLYTTTVASKTTTQEVPENEDPNASDEDTSVEVLESPAEESADEAADNGKKSLNANAALLIDNTDHTTDELNSTRASVVTDRPTNPMPATRGAMERNTMDKETMDKLIHLAGEYNMNDKLSAWISENRSYESVATEVLESKRTAEKVTHPGAPAVHTRSKDSKTTFVRAFEALMKGDNSELNERGRDIAEKNGLSVRSNALYIPTNEPYFTRTMSSTGNGQQFVANEYASFEDLLREESIMGKLGIQITAASGIVTLPRQTAPISVTWGAETGSVAASEGTYVNTQWTPKALRAMVPYSRTLGMMNAEYAVDSILRNELAQTFVTAAETAIFAGSGSLQPLGVLYDTDVPTYAANSGSFDAARARGLWATVRNNHGKLEAYVVSPQTYVAGQNTPAFAGGTGAPLIQNGQIDGVPVVVSTYLPTISGKQTAVAGQFSKITVASFGVFEIIKDELTALASSDSILLHARLYMDSKSRQPLALVKDLGIL